MSPTQPGAAPRAEVAKRLHLEDAVGLGEAMGSFAASITSPARLAFAGYVLLAFAGQIQTSKWEFLVLAVVFFVAQVLRDDYARILLNKRAERIAAAKQAHR